MYYCNSRYYLLRCIDYALSYEFSVSPFRIKSKSDEFSIRTRLCADVCPQICFISGVCKIHIFICICTKCNNCISDLQVTKAKKLIKLGADDFYKMQIFQFFISFPNFQILPLFRYFISSLRYDTRSRLVTQMVYVEIIRWTFVGH